MQIVETNDIISLHPELIVHPVNCTGLCHDGFTHQLKKTWPMYFREYTRSCLRKHLHPQEPMLCDLGTMISTRYIVALPLRAHWREVLKPEAVRVALDKLISMLVELKIQSFAIPAIPDIPEGWLEKEVKAKIEQSPSSQLNSLFILRSS